MSQPAPMLPPDAVSRALIDSRLDTSMLVEAAAGTGKTTKMVDRLVALLSAGKCRAENLAAVTFTRKAAAELRARFTAALERRAAEDGEPEVRERLARAVENVDRAFIGTIHSFCSRLLRERPVEARVAVGFEEADEETDSEVRSEAWQSWLAGLYATADPSLDSLEALGLEPGALEEAYDTLCRYPDLEDSDWPAPESQPIDSAALVRDLREYAAYMAALGPELPEDPGNDKLMPEYRLIPRLLRHLDLENPAELAELLERFRKTSIVQKNWPRGREQALGEQARWDCFSANAVTWLVSWRARRYPAALTFLLSARKAYRDLLRERGLLNYQDLLVGAARLLRSSPGVRRYFRARYTHVLVDEFQDTDPVQAEVLLLLTADNPEVTDWRRAHPAPGALFVVGDPKQSIYRFRRADIVTYEQVRRIIESGGGLTVTLSANFRSDPGLIDWVNRAFEGRFPAEADEFSPAWVALSPGRDSFGEADLQGVGLIQIQKGNQKELTRVETFHIAGLIRQALDRGLSLPRTPRQLAQGMSPAAGPGDFLIITKRKARLSQFAAQLEEFGIPYEATGGGALEQVSELKHLALALECLHRPDNPVLLAGLLRSGLYGLSDRELYAFVKADGQFDYRESLPPRLAEPLRGKLTGIFESLNKYAKWLRNVSPAAAMWRIAGDLGLFASASAARGGNLRAGGLARALELIRVSGGNLRNVEGLIAYLWELARGEHGEESLPAAGGGGPLVRLMNLHQAKGLEAPVVFLADPIGDSTRSQPTVHVDRSGARPCGYLAIREKTGPYSGKLLACHPEWSAFEEKERRFLEAENLRLLYVAATRAGSRLIVTLRESNASSNPWDFFSGELAGLEPLSAPGAPAPAPESAGNVRPDPQAASGAIEHAWKQAAVHSYGVTTAREKAGLGEEKSPERGAGETGARWGSLVHRLLQAALTRPEHELRLLAEAYLREEELPVTLASEALETVRSVTGSDIWARAVSADRQFAEAPFEALDPDSPPDCPAVVRGQIDLVFREKGGWVIVDYKTDREAAGESGMDNLAARYAPQVRLYARLWEGLTGERVAESGLYFTAADRYIKI